MDRVPVSLATRMGAELRRHREAAHRRQEEIAAVARDFGYRAWARGTVGMIESGRRQLSLEEFFALPMMLARLGIHVTLTDLVGGDGGLALSPSTTVRAETLHAMLAGRFDAATLASARTTDTRLTADELDNARAVWRRISGRRRIAPARLDALVLASQGAAEGWAAGVLRTTPLVVAMLAEHTWGRSLTAEREARVASSDRTGDGQPVARATIQAHRGHVTRELLSMLRTTRSRLRARTKTRG